MRWQQLAVERLVAGLPVREAVRETLREELVAHLAQSYEVHRRTMDPGVARELVIHILGNSDELHDMMVGSLTPAERFEGRIIHGIAPHSGRSIARHAIRKSICVWFSLCAAFIALVLAVRHAPGMDFAAASTAIITVSGFCLLLSSSIGVFMLEFHAARQARQRNRCNPGCAVRRFARSAGIVLSAGFIASLGCHGASAAVLSLCGRGDMALVIGIFIRTVLLPAMVFIATITPVLARSLELSEYDARRLPDWPYDLFTQR